MYKVNENEFYFNRDFIFRIFFPIDESNISLIDKFIRNLTIIFTIKNISMFQRDINNMREVILLICLDSPFAIRRKNLFYLPNDDIKLIYCNWIDCSIKEAEYMLLLLDFNYNHN